MRIIMQLLGETVGRMTDHPQAMDTEATHARTIQQNVTWGGGGKRGAENRTNDQVSPAEKLQKICRK